MRKTHLLVANHRPLIRIAIRELLRTHADIVLIGEATNGHAVQRVCRDAAPHVLLLDLTLPGLTPHCLISYLCTHCPGVAVLVFGTHTTSYTSIRPTDIAGYITEDEAPQLLVEAIRTIATGGVWLSQATRDTMLPCVSQHVERAGWSNLTHREVKVLELVVAGTTNREIALVLGISDKAIEKRLAETYTKLGVASRVEAAVWAVRHGLM